MRAADQGLRRHVEARLLQLPDDRSARDRAGARGPHPGPAGIDAVASARTAALLDPEGESLAKALAAIDAQVACRSQPSSSGPDPEESMRSMVSRRMATDTGVRDQRSLSG